MSFALINECLRVESPYQASGKRQAFSTQRSSEIKSLPENSLHDLSTYAEFVNMPPKSSNKMSYIGCLSTFFYSNIKVPV